MQKERRPPAASPIGSVKNDLSEDIYTVLYIKVVGQRGPLAGVVFRIKTEEVAPGPVWQR